LVHPLARNLQWSENVFKSDVPIRGKTRPLSGTQIPAVRTLYLRGLSPLLPAARLVDG
jgi:hypothetical protein